jgi:putative transposase
VYHVLNRANGRLRIFKKNGDFEAFEKILAEGLERVDMRICGYCIMGNHWHLMLWPREDGDLTEYMRWISVTHSKRYHAAHGTTGMGHLYQGRFKSFPVQDDLHYLTALRYVEANPLRAKIVDDPRRYRWSSFLARFGKVEKPFPIDPGPRPVPKNWPKLVAEVIEDRQQEKIQRSLARGVPFGELDWLTQTAEVLGLQSTLRPRGRPKFGG